MKRILMLGGAVVFACGLLAAAPAQAHDACGDDGYSGGYYQRGSYGGGYYDGGNYGGDSYHDYAHERLNDRHERWHENHPYASDYQHYLLHKRLARQHDVFHHRNYDEHAPNHARWYYGDDRDY